MCKCDNLEYTPIAIGQKVTITAFGKVEGTDTRYAKIPSFNFIFYKGNDVSATVGQRANVPATVVEDTSTKARYKAVWEFNVPQNLDTNLVYRIQGKPNCEKKIAMAPKQTVVLGEKDNTGGIWGSIFRFLDRLFRGQSQQQTQPPSGSVQNVQPTTNPNLQLDTFVPTKTSIEKDQNNCSFIRFEFAK